MISRLTGRRGLRIALGLAISVLFISVTVARVDLHAVATALTRVDPVGLALALVLVTFEVALRTLRWQLLLQPIRRVPYRSCLAYTCIGYFANSLLPARLGDVARAYLAGGAFRIERVSVLGTILVERIADGSFILLVAIAIGVVVAGGGSLAAMALGVGAILVAGLIGLALAAFVVVRAGALRTRYGALVADLWTRLAAGAVVLRSARGAAAVSALTVVAFGVAALAFAVVAHAVGVVLTPAQATLAMAAVALSMSIPAAPGSLGTYEFVGATVLTAFGISPELALATILLVHLVATLPPALAGLVAAWHLHFRIGAVADAPTGGRLTGEPVGSDPA
jgi:glycosyltransferase 2 family protein